MVPGVIDFYGDIRIGGAFAIIGGFNRRLGWATTNNAPDLDEKGKLAFEVREHLETPIGPVFHSSESSIFVMRSSDIWTHLVPWDQLPQVLNPEGGYVQNSNDPPYYTNLNVYLDPAEYQMNLPKPRLRLRTQNSLQLIHTEDKLSLEDVVALKHNMKMLLADRMKDDLASAVRAS